MALVIVLATVPMLVRMWLGSARFPNDDTWAYRRMFEVYRSTGHVRLIGWNDIALVGIFPVARLWAAVAGDGELSLRVLGAVVAAIALLGVDQLLRAVGVRRRAGPLLLVGAFTGFAVTTGTFMADQFAFAGAVWCVALAVRVVTSGWPRVTTTLAAALCAVYVVTVRQASAFTLVVAGLVLLPWRRRRTELVLLAVGFVPLALAFTVWRNGLSNGGALILSLDIRAATVGCATLFVGLGLLAAVMCAGRRDLIRRADVLVGVVVGVVALVVGAAVDINRYVDDFSSPIRLLAPMPRPLQAALAGIVAAVCTTALVVLGRGLLGLPRGSVTRRLAWGLVLGIVVELGVVVATAGYYSRYSLLSVALLVALAQVTLDVPWRSAGQWVALAVLVAISVVVVERAVAPDRAGLDAVAVARCAGIAITRIDDGLTFVGEHYEGPIVADYFDLPMIDDGLPASQYLRAFPAFERDAVVVARRPPPSADTVVVGPFVGDSLFPFNRPRRWLVARASFGPALDECRT
ncbi:MAG: hypothetical protein QM733_06475 [Ilumatobacteraceae bacterium]